MRKILRRILAAVLFALVALPAILVAAGLDPERFLNRVSGNGSWPVSAEAEALHRSSFVADLHADSLLWGRDLLARGRVGHVDLPRLREGGVALQVFTVVSQVPLGVNIYWNPTRSPDLITLLGWVNGWPPETRRSRLERALYQGRALARFAHTDGHIVLVRSGADLDRLVGMRRTDRQVVGALFGIEGAQALDRDPANLERLFEAGVRTLGLAHFFDNDFAGSAHGTGKGGLTDQGRKLVQESERRRVIIDLAHSSERTIEDVLSMATRPPLVSHTGLKATCSNPRNLSDEQLRAIAALGGLVGVGYWKTAVCGSAPADIARAIRHAVDVVGDQHVALGSDFDGAVATPFDASGLAAVTQALLDAHLEEGAIRNVLGENALRFFRSNLPPG